MKEKLQISEIKPEDFIAALPMACSRKTSLDPDGWKEDNPLWGHCAVVSLIAQDYFGGKLLRASLSEIKGFEHMHSHYWNQLENGNEVDFTKDQFKDNYPEEMVPEERTRDYVLSYPETVKRYELLKSRILDVLTR